MKSNRRNKNKYPALEPRLNLRIRHDAMHIDYLHKLSDSDKKWLNKFNTEYVNASFSDEDRLHPKVYETKIVKKTKKTRKVDVYKKSCEDSNNSRNRDSYSITKTNNILETYIPMENKDVVGDIKNEYENRLIERIDAIKI